MNWIRTTISLPEEFHEELREKAFREQKSMGEILYEYAKPERKIEVDSQIKKDIAFFKKIAKRGKSIDPLIVLRKERDRDNV